VLAYIRERIKHIHRALLEDPSALREEGRLAGEAILWNLMALTDSTARLSDELKKRHPEIQWEQVRGFRNVASHAYDRIQLKQVANIVANDLPLMRRAIDMELGPRDRDLEPDRVRSARRRRRGFVQQGPRQTVVFGSTQRYAANSEHHF